MDKIPVGETLARTYGFAFRDFLKIFGIVWAPLAVTIALGLMVTPGFFGNHIDPNDRDAMARFSLQLIPLSFLILLPIRAMIATGVTEQALGMRSGVTFVYFSLGASIWRFIASWLLVIVAMAVLIVGAVIVIGIVGAIGGVALSGNLHDASSQTTVIIAAMAIVLLFYAAILYVVVRLTFFIPSVVVAEHKVDLARVWQLSHGNFWRIFLLGVAIFVPLMFAASIVTFATYGTSLMRFSDIMLAALHGAKQTDIQTQIQAWTASMRAQALAVWPYTAVFQLAFGSLTYGLLYGASAFAYRAVLPSTAGSPRD